MFLIFSETIRVLILLEINYIFSIPHRTQKSLQAIGEANLYNLEYKL